jgi:hypothetical protein
MCDKSNKPEQENVDTHMSILNAHNLQILPTFSSMKSMFSNVTKLCRDNLKIIFIPMQDINVQRYNFNNE